MLNHTGKKYASVGVAREDGRKKGEYTCIFIDTVKFQIMHDTTFWLSESPRKVSKSWDAASKRICTHVFIKDRHSSKLLHILNTHFDHKSEMARLESSHLILNHIQKIKSNHPIILTGDLNEEKSKAGVQNLLTEFNDPLVNNCELKGISSTYNGFDFENFNDIRIDYILYKFAKPIYYKHIFERRTETLFVSDHYPVLAKFEY